MTPLEFVKEYLKLYYETANLPEGAFSIRMDDLAEQAIDIIDENQDS